MLRITLLSGENLAGIPAAGLSDAKSLKQQLHRKHGLPPRFRQRLFHNGSAMEDDSKLDSSMDLEVVAVSFADSSEDQRKELVGAATFGHAAKAGEGMHRSTARTRSLA